MADTRTGPWLAEAALTRVVLSDRREPSFAFQFLTKVLARARQTCLNKRHANVGVDGTERVVGNVNMSECGRTEKRRLSDVRFPNEANAHPEHALRIHSSS